MEATQAIINNAPAEQPSNPSANKYIYLLNIPDELNEQLCQQLMQFNYAIKTDADLTIAALHDLPATALPTAIIVDITLLTEELAQAMQVLRARAALHIPLIFFTNDNAFATRLRAVRVGGDAFFSRPINLINLMGTLDVLSVIKPVEAYRILIVEDMVSLANYYAAILQQVGMQAYVVNKPADVLQALAQFRPDLILLDIYMPDCDGYELAKIIRQENSYTSIPLVFLSSEKDKFKQLSAMSLGGDDFLTKPVVPEDLIRLVSYRIQRARLLSSLIMKDSLTGLLNHNAIQEQLKIELAQAERRKVPLTVAMLDLDHFKTINDTYGHPVGDMTLNNLCRSISKQIRKSDIAGRYGGDEFIIIFRDTEISAAEAICNKIRASFAAFQHISKADKFSITMSCGLAQYPTFNKPIDLIIAADSALYAAKKSGRNKVITNA